MRPAHRHLAELLTAAPGEQLSPACVRWLQAGALSWLQAGNGLELGRCLGLVTQQKSRDALRNDYLRRAAELMPGGDTHRAEELARLCEQMEGRLWPLWRGEAEPPERAGPVLALLFKARHLGSPLPCSVRHLFDIIATDAETRPKSRTKSPIG